MQNIIQKILPNTPSEVISIWLAPIADTHGWPPTQDNDWRYVLGKDRNLEYLQSLKWSLDEIELKPDLIVPYDRQIVIDLFRSHVLKKTTVYSMVMSNGLERFQNSCDYLKREGILPKPIILEQLGKQFHIFDGYHRVTAFFYLSGYFNISNEHAPCLKVQANQKAWIAKKIDL